MSAVIVAWQTSSYLSRSLAHISMEIMTFCLNWGWNHHRNGFPGQTILAFLLSTLQVLLFWLYTCRRCHIFWVRAQLLISVERIVQNVDDGPWLLRNVFLRKYLFRGERMCAFPFPLLLFQHASGCQLQPWMIPPLQNLTDNLKRLVTSGAACQIIAVCWTLYSTDTRACLHLAELANDGDPDPDEEEPPTLFPTALSFHLTRFNLANSSATAQPRVWPER